ncbi:MAG: hypothetical protein AAFU60_03655 [Bacteroidota bacterium]
MRTISFSFAFLLLCTSAYSQGGEKVLVKSFNLQGLQEVEFNAPGKVEVREWNNTFMRVQMAVELQNGTEAMLKSLVKAGRYNLYAKPNEDVLSVIMPGLRKQVKVGGKELEESFSFILFVPSDVQVDLPTELLSDTAGIPTDL